MLKPEAAPKHGAVPNRYLSITFDDGMQSSCAAAAAMLSHYASTGSFYVVTGWVEPRRKTIQEEYNKGVNHGSWDFWRSMASAGHEVGSHTFSHLNARGKKARFFPPILIADIVRSSLDLRRNINPDARTLSMPWNQETPLSNWVARLAFDGCVRGSDQVHYNFPRMTDPHRLRSWAPTEQGFLSGYQSVVRNIPPGGWLILQLHGLDGEGWESINTEDFQRLLGFALREGVVVSSTSSVLQRECATC